MNETTRNAICPFSDTYENLYEDNPVLREGQRIYDTKNKKCYIPLAYLKSAFF